MDCAIPQGLESGRENSSFALLGLDHFLLVPRGFRRGLYSFAAPRLKLMIRWLQHGSACAYCSVEIATAVAAMAAVSARRMVLPSEADFQPAE